VLESTRVEAKQIYNGAPPMAELVAENGVTWLEYRKTLAPDYARAWREVAICYLMLFGGYAMNIVVAIVWRVVAGLLIAPLVALWIGFWLHGLNQFAHEGAHGNLARDRKKNDLLSDWLIWPLFAQTVRSYRKSHMQHHVHLGDHLDTEINYYDCMDPWFLVKGVTGIQMVLMVVRYILKPKAAPAGQSAPAAQRDALMAVARTGVIHGLFIAIPAGFHLFGPAAAWLLGLAAVYPSFGTTRQILEHRDLPASCKTDFAKVEHGPVNRLFGDDLFSRYFGAAGLNRHLLHHWDPGISYTRLPDMEAFILRTPHAKVIRESRSTYFRMASAMLQTALQK
jgi:fatty acid desaturase